MEWVGRAPLSLWFMLEVQKLEFKGESNLMHSAQDRFALIERPALYVLSNFSLNF